MGDSRSVEIDPEVDDSDPAIDPRLMGEDPSDPDPDEDAMLLGVTVLSLS